jgi:hypothetical protein
VSFVFDALKSSVISPVMKPIPVFRKYTSAPSSALISAASTSSDVWISVSELSKSPCR